jgi:hypothetical protein
LAQTSVTVTFVTARKYSAAHIEAYHDGDSARRADIEDPIMFVGGYCDKFGPTSSFTGVPFSAVDALCPSLAPSFDGNFTAWSTSLWLSADDVAELEGGVVPTLDIVFPWLWGDDEIYVGSIGFFFHSHDFLAVVPDGGVCVPENIEGVPCTCYDGCAVGLSILGALIQLFVVLTALSYALWFVRRQRAVG